MCIKQNSDQVQAKEHVAQLISKHSKDYLQHVLFPNKQRKVSHWLKILQSVSIFDGRSIYYSTSI